MISVSSCPDFANLSSEDLFRVDISESLWPDFANLSSEDFPATEDLVSTFLGLISVSLCPDFANLSSEDLFRVDISESL